MAGTRYVFEVRPPVGWHPAPVPPPAGALMLTVGGLSPRDAPAMMMVRPIATDGDSFETFAARELEAMRGSLADGELSDVRGIDFPGHRCIAKRIRSPAARRTAMLTLVEQGDHFVWFGLLVTDPRRLRVAVAAYRGLLRTYHEEQYAALVEAMRTDARSSCVPP